MNSMLVPSVLGDLYCGLRDAGQPVSLRLWSTEGQQFSKSSTSPYFRRLTPSLEAPEQQNKQTSQIQVTLLTPP